MKSAQKRWYLVWMILLGVALGGCEMDSPWERPYTPPKPKIFKKKKMQNLAATDLFDWVPNNKRDPFRSPDLTQTALKADTKAAKPLVRRVKRRTPRTELEKFELDQIKVVATITGVANPVAMLEGPDGQGFVVRRGTTLGRNGGRITRIYSSGIVISEVTRDNAGKRLINRVMIRIKRKSGDKSRGSIKVGGRKLQLDSSGQPQYRNLKSRTNRLFRRRGVGAQ